MEHEFWHSRWEEGRTGFHQDEVHASLRKWLGACKVPAGGRILVPLAGKSWDVDWLASQGYSVTAVELSTLAAEQFHEATQRKFISSMQGPYRRYESAQCTFLVGDVFDLPDVSPDPFDLIWDRAALVALNPEQRSRYAPLLMRLLRPEGTLLLNSFRYDRDKRTGPPHSIEEDEIHRLYSPWGSVELLEAYDDASNPGRLQEWNLSFWLHSVWKMTRKD